MFPFAIVVINEFLEGPIFTPHRNCQNSGSDRIISDHRGGASENGRSVDFEKPLIFPIVTIGGYHLTCRDTRGNRP